jgi:replication-associated recombination protein RarA
MGKVEGFSMTSKPKEAAIDQIVASCNGDIRGALKALLLVNEQLEAELQQIYATVAHGVRGDSVLH